MARHLAQSWCKGIAQQTLNLLGVGSIPTGCIMIVNCKTHGLTPHHKSGRVIRCNKCANENVKRRKQKIKETLVAEAGGKCIIIDILVL